ncbi:MAG TPA: proteinase inhibitor I4 serpin [Candidatus Marinimicrobia bacterium]|jgi:hypothetical protein|nr:proteinase inhibitor I4 serpin [Candidatus Neomarinimicrobiota bacterium]
MVQIRSLYILFIIMILSCEEKKPPPLSMECYLDPDPGPCKASIPRYYYDEEAKVCKEFKWGGCDGVVPFETMKECDDACG